MLIDLLNQDPETATFVNTINVYLENHINYCRDKISYTVRNRRSVFKSNSHDEIPPTPAINIRMVKQGFQKLQEIIKRKILAR